MNSLDYLYVGYIILFFPTLMIIVAVSDFMSMTISNRVNLVLALGFFVVAPFTDLTWSQIGMHVVAGTVVLVICFILFSFNIIGGGDAKLFAATAIWLGWSVDMVTYSIYTALLGGALAIFLIFLRKIPIPMFLINQRWLLKVYSETGFIPYGIAMAISGLLVYSSGYWMNQAIGLNI